jgi:hypothetical protein
MMRGLVDDGLDVELLDDGSVVLRGLKNPSPTLERTLTNRSEAELMLKGIPITLDPGTPANDPWLNLTEEVRFDYMTEAEIDPGTGMPKWVLRGKPGKKKPFQIRSRMAMFAMSGCHLFATTTKMSAASWSIPAGPPAEGGACQAAEIYKNLLAYRTALGQGDVSHGPPEKSKWICAFCYASKSNYMHRQSQYSQTIRLIWLKGIMQAGLDYAAQAMAGALAKHQGNVKRRTKFKESPDFFRIHDSGDLTLIPDTYSLWCRVAEMLPSINFWCPTRMWVFPKFAEIVRRSPPPGNLSLRPSALHFDDKAPVIDGFDSGSTAHTWEKKKNGLKVDPIVGGLADWNCPAYKHGGKSCAGAGGPSGEKDCRACWSYDDMRISYQGH